MRNCSMSCSVQKRYRKIPARLRKKKLHPEGEWKVSG